MGHSGTHSSARARIFQDVLLETVAGPVRRYLRARKDTVRCIVASLTDETSGDLYEELRRQASTVMWREESNGMG